MNHSRLRAPSSDGALLAIPPLGDATGILARNRAALTGWDYDVQGRSASVLRDRARSEVSALALAFMSEMGMRVPDSCDISTGEDPTAIPWVVTGHQPELFHPGVWVKNFAASDIARRAGGVSLNLIVDNDLPKSASISVPAVEPEGVRRIGVGFDIWPEHEVPFEDLPVSDEATFASFPGRVHEVLGTAVSDPLIDHFWALAMSRRDDLKNVGLRFARARHEIESRWDATNLEIPLSAVCRTDAFLWFLSHLLAQLPRFRTIHNQCLKDYRDSYGIRSRNHPVADLDESDGWMEAPFWAWRAENPRRRPLLTRQVGRRIELRIAGENELLAELPLAPDREACCAVEVLRELPARSVRIRTRALTTTMFARFFLGDIFLHGIGGAKYDELGDAIAERFFGVAPPTFLTLSQTLWLGLPHDPAVAETLDRVRHQRRDAEFNPDRLLVEPIPGEARRLIEAKREAISGPEETRRQRVNRCKEIRRLNRELQSFAEIQRDRLDRQLHVLQSDLITKRIATSREYSLVLHSRRRLEDSMRGLSTVIG